MTKESIELIVLATTETGENAVVVHTLSQAYGRRGFLVHPGKKGGRALLLPLSILEAKVVENPKSTLWSLRDISLKDPLNGIRGNLHKNTMSLFLSEVLFRTLREGSAEDGLYAWCVGSILTLNALEGDFQNFHLRFLLELAGALGFRPSFQDIAPFAGEHAAVMRRLLTEDFSGTMLIPLDGRTRNVLCEELLQYLSYHTESNIHVKSLSVLREIYQ